MDFYLAADPDDANRTYLILGSLSGTSPSTPIPHAYVTLPLNWDWFTDLVWDYKTSIIFNNFLGVLDGQGQAQAQFNIGLLPPGSAGATIHFTFT